MTTSEEYLDASAQPDAAGLAQLPEDARAAVAEIKADNAALDMAGTVAESQAEVIEQHARLLNQVTEEVLEELQEKKGS
jgi:hypothetical protein